MKKLLLLLSLLPLITLAQYDYELGYWETGFWKETLKEHAEPNGKFTVYFRNGLIRYSGEFRDSLPYGDWTIYDNTDGLYGIQNPRIITNYNGVHIEYQWNGTDTMMIGHYVNGRPSSIWTKYQFRGSRCYNDTLSIRWMYDYEENELTRYVNTDYVYVVSEPGDSMVKSNSMPKTLRLQASDPKGFFSIDAGYLQRKIGMNDFNQLFKTNTQNTFSDRPDIFQFAVLFSQQENSYWSFGFNLSPFNTIETDSINYSLRTGNAVHVKYARDIVKHKGFEISPFIGVGLNFSKLEYEKKEDLYPELEPFDNLFAGSGNSTTHPESDPYAKIDFTSDEFVFDAGLKMSILIPLSKIKHQGIKVSAEAGYMYSPVDSKWQYFIKDIMEEQEDANFIPTINASGFYYGFTIGFFGFYKTEEFDYYNY